MRSTVLLFVFPVSVGGCHDLSDLTAPDRLPSKSAYTLPSSSLPAAAAVSAAQRPITNLLDAQGRFCLPDGFGGCLIVDPPIPNFFSWTDGKGLCVSIDFAGVAKRWLEEASSGTRSLPTTFTGAIIEQALDDGSTEVHVRLHTRNALAWAGDCRPGGEVFFGYRAPEVLAGAEPALGESELSIDFRNHAPGAPLPDLFKMLVLPEPTQEMTSLVFSASASGPLRAAFGVTEGTPGRATVIVVSLSGATLRNTGIPVSRVELRVAGT